jgi:hypothetical protein
VGEERRLRKTEDERVQELAVIRLRRKGKRPKSALNGKEYEKIFNRSLL